jgi:hypothetical protein
MTIGAGQTSGVRADACRSVVCPQPRRPMAANAAHAGRARVGTGVVSSAVVTPVAGVSHLVVADV